MSTRVPSLATLAHCLRIGIETLLHGIEQVLVLPSANALFPLTPEAELLANAPLSLRGPRSPALLRVYEKPPIIPSLRIARRQCRCAASAFVRMAFEGEIGRVSPESHIRSELILEQPGIAK
jgi:hypothetical protein